MKHCSALLLHCVDYRLLTKEADYMSGLGFQSDFDDVGISGSAKNLVDPYDATDPEFTLRQIEISRKVHGIKTVVVMNHTDCGAYGDGTFTSADEERARHLRDLRGAKSMIEHRFEDLKVVMALGQLNAGGTIDIETIQ